MIAAQTWKPSPYAVSVIRRPDPGGSGYSTLSVRHPCAPCIFLPDASRRPLTYISDTDTYGLISDYLELLAKVAPDARLESAKSASKTAQLVQTLTCLPLHDGKQTWRTSFVFQRGDAAVREHTLVMQAQSNLSCVEGPDKQGIRVVGHVSEQGDMLFITSMSAYLYHGPADEKAVVRVERSRGAVSRVHIRTGAGTKLVKKAAVGAKSDIVNHIDTQRPVEPASMGPPAEIRSRRPTRDEASLEQFFKRTGIFSRDVVDDCDVRLTSHLRSVHVRSDVQLAGYRRAAAHWRFAQPPKNGYLPPETADALRSDRFAMEKAYFNSNLLLERFRQFHIDPESYFRSARPTVAVHFRSGMPYGRGKDGQTVNAAVQPCELGAYGKAVPWRRHQISPGLCQEPPELHVHFALANHSHRGRKKWEGRERAPAESLGIAADPRWVWHELGHVLLMATTGELEMRFAHSPGDALAAIAADPESYFADGTHGDVEGNRRWRGATYPWVYIPRRHDRCVRRGWSWSGAMHRPIRQLEDVRQPRRKGYRSEQILSTSLYRLYLCLGGYAQGSGQGLERRHFASNYAIYLIVRGLALLGDARVVAANHPDQFVSALIDADIGTGAFTLHTVKRRFTLPGGVAHKATRWAFEAQGLYARGAVDNNDKGEPPPVDIYIGDMRATHEEWCDGRVDYGAGSYVPVAFDMPDYPNSGKGQGSSARDLPDWFSSDIKVDRDKQQVQVTVGNRGAESATQVKVRVFYARWNGGDLPPWEPGGGGVWNAMQPKGGHVQPEVEECLSFGPFTWNPQPEETYLILAEASCDADLANTDPKSGLPCSRMTVPLADLVINDNNLGLTLYRP